MLSKFACGHFRPEKWPCAWHVCHIMAIRAFFRGEMANHSFRSSKNRVSGELPPETRFSALRKPHVAISSFLFAKTLSPTKDESPSLVNSMREKWGTRQMGWVPCSPKDIFSRILRFFQNRELKSNQYKFCRVWSLEEQDVLLGQGVLHKYRRAPSKLKKRIVRLG